MVETVWKSSPIFREAFEKGPQMILRSESHGPETSFLWGNKSRRSESLLFVPIRKQDRVVGVLSIQSYRSRAYSVHGLDTLAAIATHCGGALYRLQVRADLERAEQRFRQAFEFPINLPRPNSVPTIFLELIRIN